MVTTRIHLSKESIMRKLYLILVVTSLFLAWVGAAQAEDVCYQVHHLGHGDSTAVCDGDEAGAAGNTLDTVKIWSATRNICYKAHNANVGWGPTVCDGQVAGSIGKYLQALQIWFWNGDENQSVEYQSRLQNIGWTIPRYDGTMTGTVGQSRRLEAIAIYFTPRRRCPDAGYQFASGFDLTAAHWRQDGAGNPICSGAIGFPCGNGSRCEQKLREEPAGVLGEWTTLTTTSSSTILLSFDYVNNIREAWYCEEGCRSMGSANKSFPGGLP
jgi:hypothetical protein